MIMERGWIPATALEDRTKSPANKGGRGRRPGVAAAGCCLRQCLQGLQAAGSPAVRGQAGAKPAPALEWPPTHFASCSAPSRAIGRPAPVRLHTGQDSARPPVALAAGPGGPALSSSWWRVRMGGPRRGAALATLLKGWLSSDQSRQDETDWLLSSFLPCPLPLLGTLPAAVPCPRWYCSRRRRSST